MDNGWKENKASAIYLLSLAFLSEWTTSQNLHASLLHGPSSEHVYGEKAPFSDTFRQHTSSFNERDLHQTLGPVKVDGDTRGSEM